MTDLTADPSLSVCEPWATFAQWPSTGPCAGVDAYAADEALLEASDLLNRWAGGQYPGLCADLIRPCSRPRSTRNTRSWAHHGVATDGGSYGWSWDSSWGACGCGGNVLVRACSCGGPSQISLGRWPIVSVDEVMVDGSPLDAACWRVDDDRWLVRLPDPADPTARRAWPCCQRVDLPDSEEGTWSVAFTWGAAPPPSGVTAALVLACELVRARTGDDCSLPAEIVQVVQQGLTYSLPQPDTNGRSKLPLPVKWFLDAVNPLGARGGASVWSPDLQAPGVRPGT